MPETTSTQSICALLEQQARLRPQAPAVSELRDGELHTMTWANYHQRVVDAASAFLDLGLQAHETVAILAGNRIEHLVADLATAHCGAVSVTLYPALSAEQPAHVVSDAQPRIIIVDGLGSLARIAEIPWVVQNRPVLVTLDGEPTHGELHWQELTAAGAERREHQDATLRTRQAVIRADDPVTYVYTSGTSPTTARSWCAHPATPPATATGPIRTPSCSPPGVGCARGTSAGSTNARPYVVALLTAKPSSGRTRTGPARRGQGQQPPVPT